MKRSLIFAFLLIICCETVWAQKAALEPADSNSDAATKEAEKRARQIARKNVLKNGWFPPSKRDYAAVAPEVGDVDRFAEFLKTPNTGLIRLHDAANCKSARNVVNVAEPCPSGFILGKATSYSFRAKKYRTANFSDLVLSNKALYTVGLNSQGILVGLGDAALETVSLANPAVKALVEFTPAINAAGAVREAERFAKGVRAGKYTFQKSARIKENETYALRAVAYKSKMLRRVGAFTVNILDDDKRDDVIIAFRVVNSHEDGSFSLLWKELDRNPAPKLVFEEQEAGKVGRKN